MYDNKNTRKDFIKKMLFGFGVIVPFSSLLFNKSNKKERKPISFTTRDYNVKTISKNEADQMLKGTKNNAINKIVPKPAPIKKVLDNKI